MTDAVCAFAVVLWLVALVLLWPAKYDPAIRFKEWLEKEKR